MSEDALVRLYNECDPACTAEPRHYVDCESARGGGRLLSEVREVLRLAEGHQRFLFTGHIGSGKSSELVRLSGLLEQSLSGTKRYYPIFLNTAEYLHDFDVTVTDILLSIVTEVAHLLRTRFDHELQSPYVIDRFRELKGLLASEIELKEVDTGVGFIKAKLQRIKRDPTAREKVRAHFDQKQAQLVDEVNAILEEARTAICQSQTPLGEEPYSDIVLILDNLEKIKKIGDREMGYESHRELFIERAPQLTALRAHTIFTIPLSLAYRGGLLLKDRFNTIPIVLPMIRVELRGRQYAKCEHGHEVLRNVLQRRVGASPLNDVIDEDAIEYLIKYSGGHIRTLLQLTRKACTYKHDTPIDKMAAVKSVQGLVSSYSTGIEEGQWPILARLDASPHQRIAVEGEHESKLLENLGILEYIDGGEEGDFESCEPWYAVHPIVRELRPFKAAREALRNLTP